MGLQRRRQRPSSDTETGERAGSFYKGCDGVLWVTEGRGKHQLNDRQHKIRSRFRGEMGRSIQGNKLIFTLQVETVIVKKRQQTGEDV